MPPLPTLQSHFCLSHKHSKSLLIWFSFEQNHIELMGYDKIQIMWKQIPCLTWWQRNFFQLLCSPQVSSHPWELSPDGWAFAEKQGRHLIPEPFLFSFSHLPPRVQQTLKSFETPQNWIYKNLGNKDYPPSRLVGS